MLSTTKVDWMVFFFAQQRNWVGNLRIITILTWTLAGFDSVRKRVCLVHVAWGGMPNFGNRLITWKKKADASFHVVFGIPQTWQPRNIQFKKGFASSTSPTKIGNRLIPWKKNLFSIYFLVSCIPRCWELRKTQVSMTLKGMWLSVLFSFYFFLEENVKGKE